MIVLYEEEAVLLFVNRLEENIKTMHPQGNYM